MFRTVSNGQSIHNYIPPDLKRMFYKNPSYVHASQSGCDPYGFSTDGLVLYIPMFALQNNVAFKSVDAYKHTCTITNALWTPQGRTFAGNGKIVVTDHAAFNITTTLTVMAWIKVTDITAAQAFLFNKYVTSTNNREWTLTNPTTTGNIQIFFGDPIDGTSEGNQLSDAAHLVNNTWALVGFTFSSGTCIIYFNGAAVASTATTVPASLFNGSADVQLGAYESAGYLTGSEGEGWIYNRVLSAGEMLHTTKCTNWRYQ